MEDNKEICEAYNKIFKKVDKDGMDKVRRYMGNNVKDILNYCLIIFLIYPIILMYIDAVCTKLSLEELQNETCIIYTIITFNLINILLKNENKIEEIKNFSEKIIGEPDKLFQFRTEKRKRINYVLH